MSAAVTRWGLAILVLATAAWFTATNVTEAFGAGSPYYSRTTNMDKWEDPVPMLVVVDVVALLAVGLLLRPIFAQRADPRR